MGLRIDVLCGFGAARSPGFDGFGKFPKSPKSAGRDLQKLSSRNYRYLLRTIATVILLAD